LPLSHRTGALLVLGAGVMFSFGSLFFRATDTLDAWQYLTFRGYGAFLAVLPVLWLQNRGDLGAIVRRVEARHVLAGLIVSAMMIAFIVALTHTDTAFILLFQAAGPISAAVFSWLLLRERMSRDARIAAGGAALGVAIMVSGGVDAGVGWAILIVLVIPVGLGLYGTLVRSAVTIDPLVPVVIAGFVAGSVGLVVSLLGAGFDVAARDIAIALLAGVALIALPLPFFNHAQKVVPAPEATLLLMSEIVLGPFWVWLVYAEEPTGATLVGGAVMLAAVVWLTQRSMSPDRRIRTSRG
jgi:drug/metabolite transporter (DMT)-like permease